MSAEAAALSPQLVVIIFTGIPNRPCIAAQGAYGVSWENDLQQVASFWAQRGTRVLLVGLPGEVSGAPTVPIAPTDPSFDARSVARMEADVASGGNPLVRYVDLSPVFVGADGRYDQYLSCLPTEGAPQGCGAAPAPAGQIQVRNTDGQHFCVVGHLSAIEACPVYSSGVLRLAQSVAQATEGWPLPSNPTTAEEAAAGGQLVLQLRTAWSGLAP